MLLLLSLACAPETTDSDEPRGPAGWSECVSYPTGTVTCNEVCADEGKLCAAGQCDGATARRYNWAECTATSDDEDFGCTQEFDVSTSAYASAHCCCW